MSFSRKNNLSGDGRFQFPALEQPTEQFQEPDDFICWMCSVILTVLVSFWWCYFPSASSRQLELIETLHHRSRLGRLRSLISVVGFFFSPESPISCFAKPSCLWPDNKDQSVGDEKRQRKKERGEGKTQRPNIQ